MTYLNVDALVEAEGKHLSAGERRRLRHEYDPYSKKAIRESLQQMIMGALHDVGGRRWLAKQAEANPAAFLAFAGKMLPIEARIGGDGDIRITVVTADAAQMAGDAPGVLNTPLKLVTRGRADVDADNVIDAAQG